MRFLNNRYHDGTIHDYTRALSVECLTCTARPHLCWPHVGEPQLHAHGSRTAYGMPCELVLAEVRSRSIGADARAPAAPALLLQPKPATRMQCATGAQACDAFAGQCSSSSEGKQKSGVRVTDSATVVIRHRDQAAYRSTLT